MKSKKKHQPKVIIPVHRKVMEKFGEMKPSGYTHMIYNNEWRKLIKNILASGKIADTQNVTAEELEQCLAMCEEEIAALAGRFECFTLLFWMRRLAPENIFNLAVGTVHLYRDVMTLSIFKYGKPGRPSEARNNLMPPSMLPYIQMEDDPDLQIDRQRTWPLVCYEIENVVRLEILCVIYVQLTQRYRWQAKGGRAYLEDDWIGIEASEELQECVRLYDKRLAKSNIFADLGSRFPIEKKGDKDFLVLPQLNVDRAIPTLDVPIMSERKVKKKASIDRIKVIPNYITPSIDLSVLRECLLPYDSVIRNEHGFSVDAFIRFMELFNQRFLVPCFTSVEGIMELFYRAYFPIKLSPDTPLEDLVSNLREVDKEPDRVADEELRAVAAYLVCTDRAKIDLWHRKPKKLLYNLASDFWICDLTEMLYCVVDLMTNIASKDGDIGTVKGSDLEDQLKARIVKEFGKDALWLCQQKVQGRGNKEKEIDASMVIGDTLYIFESKGIHVPQDYDCGKKKELEKRRRKLKKAMKEAKEKIEFLWEEADNLHLPENEGGSKVKLPDVVKRMVPIVITGLPEYIWNQGADKYLDESYQIPAFLTIDEIHLLKTLKP